MPKFMQEFSTMFVFIWLLVFVVRFPSSDQYSATDYTAIMAFKSSLVLKPDNIVSTNWTSTSHFCSWFGVSCLNNQTVTDLRLPGLSLAGQLSPGIANLTHLTHLDLSKNALSGTLPTVFSSLRELKLLNLTINTFHGEIPTNLTGCQKLQQLDLAHNFLTGKVPDELGSLANLQYLSLDHNNLTGKIPAGLGNLSGLSYLYLNNNGLFDEIPEEFGKLSDLKEIALRRNNLTGSIPHLIFNISSLQILDFSINALSGRFPENLGHGLSNLEQVFLGRNRITGQIPRSLSNASKLIYLLLPENDLYGELPNGLFSSLCNLQWFDFEYNRISGTIPYDLFNISSLEAVKARNNYLTGNLPDDLGNNLPNIRNILLSRNRFSGTIPPPICNATKLTYLEVANNSLTGPVPMSLGNLVDLEHLNLQINSLTNDPLSTYLDFLNSMANCRNLQFLILDSNPFDGVLPESTGNLSTSLKVFTAESCGLKGSIPEGIGNLTNVYFVGLSNNGLHGEVPASFHGLQRLEGIYLTGNYFKGSIPTVFCTMKMLGTLDLSKNQFSGSIPTCINNLTELRELSFAANDLNATLPLAFWQLLKLEGLNLSRNHFHGAVSDELGNLKSANIIDLSWNNFSGQIPNLIGSLFNLVKLYLSQNEFSDSIPDSFRSLAAIEILDLSSNRLSGVIPASLGSLRNLDYLNLSYNMLQGEVPQTRVFTNITFEYLMGNLNLCGGPRKLNLKPCPHAAQGRRRRMFPIVKIMVPIIAAAAALALVLACLFARRKRHAVNVTTLDPFHVGHRVITYHDLVRATEGFNETNLVGKGSSGTVYKGELSDGTDVAIKVFDMEYARALRNFEDECEVLRRVRHRNLVRIISTCTNLDFKAMVLEYAPNGSLEKWLYPEGDRCSLSLVQRLDIAIGVAEAIAYLHHDYVVPVVHCDLKPSNVLLDKDMMARVADFGIAKILANNQEFIRTRTLGTIGYVAPEYGRDGRVSTKGDVYSFGIFLLEMLTRKKPTDEMFGEGLNLQQWVSQSFPGPLADVLDCNLVYDEEGSHAPSRETVASIIHVALQCSNESPEDRIDMREAMLQLIKVKDELRRITG